MILDRGTCRILRKTSTTPAGGKPTSTLAAIHESYYGELSFETAPARPTGKREDMKTATRVRILQCRSIRNQDVAELTPFDGSEAKTEKYLIARAWHGDDSDSGEPITDLTLEVYEKYQTARASTPAAPAPGNGQDAGEVTGNDGE